MLILITLIPFLCGLSVLLPVTRMFRIRLFVIVSFVHSISVASFWCSRPTPEFQGYLVLDALGLLFLSVISFLFLSVSVFMLGYFKHEKRNSRTFTACLMFLLCTMTVVTLSNHMGLLWVAVEATTLFSAPLISFHRTRESLEATWKYLLICSVGIALALMGTFFLAIAAHQVDSLMLPAVLSGASALSVNWLKISVIFLLVGYGCKLGLAPMHSWKPEAYGRSTGMTSVLMAGGLTQCAFLALVRVSQICFKTGLGQFYGSILILTGILSLIVAAVFVLGEKNLKRSFAYSSIEHMGILVLGLGLGGVGIFGALFHVINNALAKVVMFLTAGSVAQKYGSANSSDVRGVIHLYPVTGILLIIALFGGTGMFPFATFHSELMIINAAVMSKRYLLAGTIVLSLGIIFIGLAKIVLGFVYGRSTEPVLPKRENAIMNAVIALAAALLVVLGIWMPAPLTRVISDAAALIGSTP
ncbi:MAG: hydrogenase [Candidatus Omnitrophica bacterium]|nr:hydrogenase [Candidatus Omnitrophota bacterium]